MPARHAFTLIELLVVVSILAVLMAPLTAVVHLAQKSGQRTQAQALLRKVDTAVRMFREDVGTYPYQDHPTVGTLDANDLGWRLAHTATDDEKTALKTDLSSVSAAYAIGGGHCVAIADVDPAARIYQDASTAWNNVSKSAHAAAVNRMAAERGRLAVMSGNVHVQGIGTHKAANLLPGKPASRGWCDNYLAGELAPRERKDGAAGTGAVISDPHGEPLRYVCPVTAGVRGFWPTISVEDPSSDHYTSVPVRIDYYGLGVSTRRTATTSRDGDRTTSAAARMVTEPELWSAGADRSISAQRKADENRDNISAAPYDKDLQ